MKESSLISDTYIKYYDEIFAFIVCRTKNSEIAADITQDVFLRLLNHKEILCTATIKNLIYIIARNLTTDYFRHKTRYIDMTSYLYDIHEDESQSADEKLRVENIEYIETLVLKKMPVKRRCIYTLSCQKGLKTKEIAEIMKMEKHAVDFQLYLSRKIMREYFNKICI